MADQQASKRRTFRKLNPQRRKLLQEIAKGKSIGAAGIAAGYAQPQNANRAIQQMRAEIIAALAKYGWDIDRFARHQISLLEAKKMLFFQNEGIVTDQREVYDNAIRLGAGDQCLKILGAYAPLSVEHSGAVHVLTEAEKREAAETVKRLMAYDSESENPIETEVEVAGEEERLQ